MTISLPAYSKPRARNVSARPPAAFSSRRDALGPSGILALSPAAWYRLNRGITVVTGVSQWDDHSGNARHLTQATGSLQPVQQADGSLLFDGADDLMRVTFTLNQPETTYCLFKQVTWTLNDRIYDGNAANGMALAQNPATPQLITFAGATGINVSPAVGSLCVVAAVFNGAASLVQLNQGVPVAGTVGANNAAGITLGAQPSGNYGNVQIYEFIVFPSAHDSATIRKVVAYLGAVGGLAL